MNTLATFKTERIVSVTTGTFESPFKTKAGKSLHEILSYSNVDVIARIMHEENLSIEEAESLFFDVLLYLWLGERVGSMIVPTVRIDLGWHVFIMFTRDYAEFCHEYFGKFVHHVPRKVSDKPDGGAAVRRSRDFGLQVFVEEMGLSLSANWIYAKLEKFDNGNLEAGDCCGNCGQGCCSR